MIDEKSTPEKECLTVNPSVKLRRRWHWLGGVFAMGRRTDMNAPVTFGDYGIEQLIENHVNGMTSTYPIRWDERSLLLQSKFTMPSGGMSAYKKSE